MMRVVKFNKAHFTDMLAIAFENNQSANYIVQQDRKRGQRIKRLMAYAHVVCERCGKVLTTVDGYSCALILFPDQKEFSLSTLVLDLKLILGVIGIQNPFKVLRIEKLINQQHSEKFIYYLWFIAVDPKHQGEGMGTELLKKLIADANSMQRSFYLETLTLKNISWYQKPGFQIYDELDIGYRLYFLKHLT